MDTRLLMGLVLSLSILGLSSGSLAQSPVKQAATHYWYDGQTRRPIWIDDTRMADFNGGERSHAAVVKAMPAAKTLDAKSSPLFRDQADGDARTRALPGGVVVRLRQVLPAEQAYTFLSQRGLKAVREIGSGTGLWLVESAPGMASLELANRLHESGEFAAATPNWWEPRALK